MTEAQQELQTADNTEVAQSGESVSLMAGIVKAASDPSTDVEKMERLWQMYERIEARQAEAAFNQAMSRCQKRMRQVSADADNNQTRSKYATYSKLDKALRPIYTAEGFSLSFDTGDAPAENYVRVLCYVSHEGGHTRTYKADMPADGKGAKGNDVMTKTHAAGSAMSYGSRYLLKLIFNVAVGEDDDDGNQAGETRRPAQAIDGKTASRITDLLEATGSNEANFLRWVFAGKPPEGATVSDIPASMGDKAIQKLEAKYKQQQGAQ